MQNSPEYTLQLEKLDAAKSFGNASAAPKILTDFLAKHTVNSILDFGCGKGTPLDMLKSDIMDIYSYDPITHPIELPEAVDLVYSRDVLEHIEPEQIDTVLEKLFAIGTRYQHHFIACHPAKKRLSDGRNAHLIIEEPKWWKDKIEQIPGWKIIFENTKGPKPLVRGNIIIDIVKYTVILEKED